jgi:hypothetical protein
MKLILLRGSVPTDRNPNEIKYGSLEKNNDIYELMAERLGDEGCEIVYWGGKYEKRYTEKCRVKWVKNLKKYRPPFDTDLRLSRMWSGFVAVSKSAIRSLRSSKKLLSSITEPESDTVRSRAELISSLLTRSHSSKKLEKKAIKRLYGGNPHRRNSGQ